MAKKVTSQNVSSDRVTDARARLFKLFKERPMPDEELLVNLYMYMRSGSLAKLLFLDEIYRKIVQLPGAIFEFGVWMGASTIAFENLRAVHEPYNYQRRIVAFDTFQGYTGISLNDISSEIIGDGVYTVAEGYERYLEDLLDYHETENVMSHIKKHTLVKGDASVTCSNYLDENPHQLIALAYFDMALYEPTRACLKAIKPRLMKNSIIVFDELCNSDYPGETKAFLEVFGTEGYSIYRSNILPDRTYLVIG